MKRPSWTIVGRGTRRARAAAAIALAATTLLAAQANAASIVYTKDGNVWIANPDGSGQYQVTLDGSPTFPYLHASQSDNGTIVANKGQQLFVLKQNGAVVATIDQESLLGPPSNPAISPDGTLIAHDAIRAACGVANTRCATTVVRGIDGTERGLMRGGITRASWVANSRLIGPIGQGVWYSVMSGGAPSDIQSWFDVSGLPFTETVTFSDPELSPAGDKLAVLANPERLALYSGNGPIPAVPTYQCAFQDAASGAIFESPSWSPDGTALAWAQGDGIWSMTIGATIAAGCPGATPTRIIPGGKGPDWGPANVSPGPRPSPSSPGSGDGGSLKVGLTSPKTGKLGALRTAGFKVRTSVTLACTGVVGIAVQKAEARRLKLGTADLIIGQVGPAKLTAGTFTATIKLRAKYRAKLKGAKRLNAAVFTSCLVGSGTPVTTARRVTFTA